MKKSEIIKIPTLIANIDDNATMSKVINLIKDQQRNIKAKAILIAKATFSVGDTVNIRTKTGNRVGVITKVNRSRCDCTIKGQSYTVPMTIMEAV